MPYTSNRSHICCVLSSSRDGVRASPRLCVCVRERERRRFDRRSVFCVRFRAFRHDHTQAQTRTDAPDSMEHRLPACLRTPTCYREGPRGELEEARRCRLRAGSLEQLWHQHLAKVRYCAWSARLARCVPPTMWQIVASCHRP